jgi:hypothetical protein
MEGMASLGDAMPSVAFRRLSLTLCFDYPSARLRPRRACFCFVKRFVLGGFGYFLVSVDERLGWFVAGIVTPVRLHEHGVDLFETDGFCLVSHGFEQGADAEVFYSTQGAFGTALDEREGFGAECGVGEAYAVELIVDKMKDGIGSECVKTSGVGDAVFDVGVLAELESSIELRMTEEDEVMIFGEVF